MKVAIASLGENENSQISPVGGRAPYYLIFENKKLVKVIKNPFRIGGGGAGFGVAKMLADEGVEMVVAGRIGPNMKAALEEKGIKYLEATGVVREVLDKLS